jgi:TRAP-type C4-dicarboxylate transport system permease small subunit
VFGHHAHIVKGLELYRGRPIFHGLGNGCVVTHALSPSQHHAVRAEWARRRKEMFGFEPDPAYTLAPFHPEAVNAMIGRLLWHKDGRIEAGIIPVHVEAPGRPVIADHAQARRIKDYVETITVEAGLPFVQLEEKSDMSGARPSRSRKALVMFGGVALLLAVAIDGLAVIGRHVGVPLLGSIEVVQAAVLIVSSVALVIATLDRRHAVVHLLVNRLGDRPKAQIERAGNLLAALLFLAFLIGSGWIALDMRGGHEESELLHIPYAPLRLVELAGLAAVAIICLIQAIRGRRP